MLEGELEGCECEEYDEIDELLLELAVKLGAFDRVDKLRTWDVEEHVDEGEVAERVSVTTALSALYSGLRYLELSDDPLSKYVVLRCFVALLRLKSLASDCREVLDLCEELLKLIRRGLVKLREEELRSLSGRVLRWRRVLIA